MPLTSPTTVHIRTHYRVCTVVPVDICTMYMSTCVRSKHMCWLFHWHFGTVRAVSGSTCCGCGLWSDSGSGAGSNSHFNHLPLYICTYVRMAWQSTGLTVLVVCCICALDRCTYIQCVEQWGAHLWLQPMVAGLMDLSSCTYVSAQSIKSRCHCEVIATLPRAVTSGLSEQGQDVNGT